MDEFETKILEIDAKRLPNGVLGKMDAILRLAKQGYERERVLIALDYVSRHIKNDNARQIAYDVYAKRVR